MPLVPPQDTQLLSSENSQPRKEYTECLCAVSCNMKWRIEPPDSCSEQTALLFRKYSVMERWDRQKILCYPSLSIASVGQSPGQCSVFVDELVSVYQSGLR